MALDIFFNLLSSCVALFFFIFRLKKGRKIKNLTTTMALHFQELFLKGREAMEYMLRK